MFQRNVHGQRISKKQNYPLILKIVAVHFPDTSVTPAKLHGVTSQKTVFFMVTATCDILFMNSEVPSYFRYRLISKFDDMVQYRSHQTCILFLIS
jgi:hypothetical protein